MNNINFDFTGQNFVITGASSGIGRQTALELLQAGANVLGIARHMTENLNCFRQYGNNLLPIDVDVAEEKDLEAAVDLFVRQKGFLSGTVHAAGIGSMIPIKVWNIKKAQDIMNVNLWAGMSLLKIASKKKYAGKEMSHIYISSVSAKKGQKGLSIYGASKGAVESMTRCAAQELADKKQRVNSVCLGWIDTPLTQAENVGKIDMPLGIGRAEDAAGLIQFLLSDRARWITGSNFVADGGYLA